MKVVQVCKYSNQTVEGVDLFEEVLRSVEDHDRKFYVFHGDTGNLAERLGCEIINFGFSKSAIKHIRPTAVFKLLLRLLQDRPDVIVTHRFKPAVFVAWLAPFLPRTRKIAVIHAIGEFKKPRRYRFARMMMSGWTFVACSSAVRTDMIDRGVPAKQVIAIPNAVDEALIRRNLLSREQARQELGIPKNAPRVIGCIGRMRSTKGHRYFIDAMREMENPPFVVVIGDGELLEEMRSTTEANGLSERLLFVGGRKNAYRYMSAFDAFVMPSLREGLPIAMLEAIAAGLPAYGTPTAGIPDILRDPAWLFPAQDASALRALLVKLKDSSDEQLNDTHTKQHQIFLEDFGIDRFRAQFKSTIEGTSAETAANV